MNNYIKIDNNQVDINVSVYVFKDGDAFIAYCPSLDLSGYDKTEEKARSDFKYMLQDWLKTQVANGTLQKDLKAHGWNISINGGAEPGIGEMLGKQKSLRVVVDKPEYLKTNVSAELYSPNYEHVQA